jgi:hypothetical protein
MGLDFYPEWTYDKNMVDRKGNDMNFYEAVNGGQVVGSDEWLNLIVVWRGGATFNVLSEDSARNWVEVDVFTNYEANSSNAASMASDYFGRVVDEMSQYHMEAA